MKAALPYFMSNNEWFVYDEEIGECRLTNKAPPEAIKNYEEEMKMKFSKDGEYIIDV